jgi:hypothetical protein
VLETERGAVPGPRSAEFHAAASLLQARKGSRLVPRVGRAGLTLIESGSTVSGRVTGNRPRRALPTELSHADHFEMAIASY